MPSRRRSTLSLIACIALAVPAFGADNSLDGTYSGKRVLTKGDPVECTVKEDRVSIVIHGKELTFKNSRTTAGETITYDPRPDGTFGQLSADDNGVVVAIRGHVGDGALDSDVTDDHCSYHWHLEKQH